MVQKLYYENAYTAEFDARVLDCRPCGDCFETILDRTAFFPEGGGQSGDAGKIGAVSVFDTKERDGEIIHLSREPVPVGETLACAIDFATRFERMQCHSGEHIVSGIVHSLYGFDNVGFHLGDDEMTVDYNGVLDEADIRRVELLANEAAAKNTEIRCFFPTANDASALVYRSKLDIAEGLRLVEIPGVDLCACCAPHVARTGEIGIIKLLDTIHYKGGVRIRMLCGLRALRDYRDKYAAVRGISTALSAKQSEVEAAVGRLCCALDAAKRDAAALRRALAEQLADGIACGSKKCCIFAPLLYTDAMRTLANLAVKKCDVFAVFSGDDTQGYNYVAASETKDMRGFVKEMNAALKGRGGGSSQMVCGSVPAHRIAIEEYFKE